MKQLVLVAALGGLVAVAATSCSVDRRSSALTCEHDHDCHDGRHCDRGYCVNPSSASGDGCPSACTSCDLGAASCRIECSADHPCGDVTCPPGFGCTVKCSDAASCGDVTCGPGLGCDVTCAANGACGDIHCDSACKCDVHCSGTSACGNMTCPQRRVSCTHDKMANEACDSSVDSTCDLCP